MEDIKVWVCEHKGRKALRLRYKDPLTGKDKYKSAKTSKMGDAVKAAGKWEDELRTGRYCAPSKATWEDFREKYENEVTAALAPNTARKSSSVFNSVETILAPKRVQDVTAERISYFASTLRKAGRSEDTIKGQLAYLKAALSKAVEWGMIPKRPTIAMPKRASGAGKAKGRPITGEEFDRLLAAVPKIVGDVAAPSWKFYLHGLWLSGLRLAESLELHWDADNQLCVDLTGKYPILRIPAALEKGHQDRELPMAPEFARFLREVPQDQRSGPVFHPLNPCALAVRASADKAGRTLTDIGSAAGVVVKKSPKKAADGEDATRVKYASAHDLRRSFGDRWASRVMPQVLMQLMRHESIETTLKYYVGRNAQSTAAVLWEADATHEKQQRATQRATEENHA